MINNLTMSNTTLHNVTTTGQPSPGMRFEGLWRFSEGFMAPHGVISLVIALAGIIFQILNIIVLCNKKMRNPVNLLLTVLAIFEIMLLIVYIPFITIFNLQAPPDWMRFHTDKLSSARYLLFYADSSVFFHLTASWLIIATACFRFIFVQFPLHSSKWCSYPRAVLTVILTAISTLVTCIPNIIVNEIISYTCEEDACKNITVFTVSPTGRGSFEDEETLALLNFWIFVTMGKFIPSILLVIFTVFLVKILHEANKRKERLTSGPRSSTATASTSLTNNGMDSRKTSKQRSPKHKNEHRQTTRMLLAVVVLFLLIELPHGILIIYVSVTDHYDVYEYLAEVIDLVTLIAFSINFILYSSMSRQYRTLFIEMFTKRLFSKINLNKLRIKYNRAPQNYEQTAGTESCVLTAMPDGNTVLSVDE